jgi:CubicO group peptidase (beta-lactamase class C family)
MRARYPNIRSASRTTVAILALCATLPAAGFSAGDPWQRWSIPEEAGFSSEALEAAEELWRALPDAPFSAFMLIYRGKILASFGDETYPFWCHSMRKSLLSTLFGKYVSNGTIDLDATLQDLRIDDTTPLTEAEKQARVVHLLKARSGVYIEAACEIAAMKAARPERGSHAPDTFWYYNNWDFNALGTIFRQETGRDIFHDFNRRIARKIGMEDFQPDRCSYEYESEVSMHPCYTFRMSTRDRARFGQLLLQNGKWGKRQIIPEKWVAESTRAYSWDPSVPGRGYGYMWWIYEPEFFQLVLQDSRLHALRAIAASGYGGQAILVLPDAEMVIVFSADVYAGADLDILETAPLLETLLTGREIIDLRLLRARAKPRTVSPGEILRLLAKSRNASTVPSLATTVDFYLSPSTSLDGAHRIGSATLRALQPGKRKATRLRVEVPSGLEPGTYFLLVQLDGNRDNYDLDRANNVKLGTRITVQ